MYAIVTSMGWVKGNFGMFHGRVSFSGRRIKAKLFTRKADAERRWEVVQARSTLYPKDRTFGITGEVVEYKE